MRLYAALKIKKTGKVNSLVITTVKKYANEIYATRVWLDAYAEYCKEEEFAMQYECYST